ncbi:MAG TPA: MBL fold metallo-hydrolase [Anaerolineales bacterium]|nr:MBL fold metallo-hydrolase [Anaerolineales bacterium]
MEITWYGMSCFRLVERGLATVVTDPFDSSVGLAVPKLRADVITISHDAPGHNNTAAVKGERRVVQGPGEFEIGGVFITGIAMNAPSTKKGNGRPNTLYVLDYEGLTIAHLGDLAYVPTQPEIEGLGSVDIALVPVGGGGALNPSQAVEVVSLIEPKLVIPMHYKTGKETAKLGPVARFLSEMGTGESQALDSLKATKSSLSDETQVILLERAAASGG